MKCIGKKKNGEDCRNNAMKDTKYCYVHSFGKFRGIPWHKNATIHLIVTLVVALYAIFFGPTKANQNKIEEAIDDVPHKIVGLLDENKLNPDKISLQLRYAYVFDNYLGSTDTFGNEDRKIDPKVPLRKKYEPNGIIGFVFAIGNENEGIPFINVYLEVIFPDDVLGVEYGEGWQPQRVNKRYTYYFPQINNRPLNTYSSVGAKFPGPGEYVIFCSIDGSGIQKPPMPVKVILY